MPIKSSAEDLVKIARAKQKERAKDPGIPEDYLDRYVREALREGRISSDGDIYQKR